MKHVQKGDFTSKERKELAEWRTGILALSIIWYGSLVSFAALIIATMYVDDNAFIWLWAVIVCPVILAFVVSVPYYKWATRSIGG